MTETTFGGMTVFADVKGVPRVTTQDVFCDGCEHGSAKVKIAAKPGEGHTARTMRLCTDCAADLWNGLNHWIQEEQK